MSLTLARTNGTPEAKVDIGDGTVSLGEYEIPLSDFCETVRYVLTNANIIAEDDPRIQLIEDIRGAQYTQGWGEDPDNTTGIKRIALPDQEAGVSPLTCLKVPTGT